MPPAPTRRLDAESRGDLVAYLDGELPAPRRAQLDAILETNPVARKELESLEKTWALLDELPKETATPTFTAATMAAITAERPVVDRLAEDAGAFSKRATAVLAWLAIPAACGFAATFITARVVPTGREAVTEDFAVLKDLDLYQQVGSLEFLEALRGEPLVIDAEATR